MNKILSDEDRATEIKNKKILSGEILSESEEVIKLKSISSALIGNPDEEIDEILTASSLNEALKMFAQDLPEGKALKIAAIYPRWRANNEYQADEIVRFGKNQDNEPQIYRVVTTHVSESGWMPDTTPALFTKLGFTEEGVPLWIQPLGVHDSYEMGDVVAYADKIWKSTAHSNVWQPGVFGWVETTEIGLRKGTNSKK